MRYLTTEGNESHQRLPNAGGSQVFTDPTAGLKIMINISTREGDYSPEKRHNAQFRGLPQLPRYRKGLYTFGIDYFSGVSSFLLLLFYPCE